MEHEYAVRRAVQFINTNVFRDIDLESLADHSGYSISHFHAIFREITGQSPAEYIRFMRLQLACWDLAFTRVRILDIALKYKFSTQESFTRAFVRRYGMSPGRFRGRITGGAADVLSLRAMDQGEEWSHGPA